MFIIRALTCWLFVFVIFWSSLCVNAVQAVGYLLFFLPLRQRLAFNQRMSNTWYIRQCPSALDLRRLPACWHVTVLTLAWPLACAAVGVLVAGGSSGASCKRAGTISHFALPAMHCARTRTR